MAAIRPVHEVARVVDPVVGRECGKVVVTLPDLEAALVAVLVCGKAAVQAVEDLVEVDRECVKVAVRGVEAAVVREVAVVADPVVVAHAGK